MAALCNLPSLPQVLGRETLIEVPLNLVEA